MEEKIKTDKNPQVRQDNLALVKEIRTKLEERFPDFISTLKANKIMSTNDKPSVIILSISSALESVLKQLIREVSTLMTALAKNKPTTK